MSSELDITLHVDALEQPLSGIGRYAWELARRLPARSGISSVRFYVRNRLIDDPGQLLRGDPIYPGRGIVRARRAWRARRALRSTIVHGPNYFLPRGTRTGVITVHDLSVFRYPETHPIERVQQFERLFAESLERAAHVITDTETVREEIVETFALPREKVTAVSLGVSERFKPCVSAEIAGPLKKLGLEAGGYALCISALEPRKKIPELLATWRRLPESLRSAYPLAYGGSKGWKNDEIHDELRRGADEGWLRYLGYVAEADLPHLYAGAALFLYPSIYEGFGLPPVEAMASGVPVLVARRSCLPEVCGDAAQYVDPDDDNDFLTSIQECLENSAWKAQAIRRGLERAAGFTWERCVNDTVTVYGQIKSH